MLRLGGQLRVLGGFDRPLYVGWDLTAALALGRAMGLADWLLAEILPDIERVAIAGYNNGDRNG